MNQQRHVIKRQVIEVSLTRQEDAWQVQQTLSRIFRQRAPAILDRYLSEFNRPDYLQRIDHLEIDLGELDADRLESELLNRMGPALRQALADNLNNKQAEVEAMTAHLQLIEQFLREGNLPWWADSRQRKAPENSLNELLTKAPMVLRQSLIKLMQDPRSLQRVIAYFDDEHLIAIFALISKASQNLADTLLQTLSAIIPQLSQLTFMPKSKVRLNLWQSLLQVAAAGEPKITRHADFLKTVILRWAKLQGLAQQDITSLLQQQLVSRTIAGNPWLGIILQEAKNKPSDGNSTDKTVASDIGKARAKLYSSDDTTDIRTVVDGMEQPLTSTAFVDEEVNDVLSHEERAFNDTDAIYINNAGLCILWPYLNPFFESLGLVQQGTFINDESQQCAVGLLFYLTHGDFDPPEYWLPLNKVLCGLSINDSYETPYLLSDEQIAASDTLIASVIANASILNNMSINGFRGSFLLRQGSLSADAGCWLLRVDRETYDIVLGSFPWTWQWFKLPWMEFPVRVEW